MCQNLLLTDYACICIDIGRRYASESERHHGGRAWVMLDLIVDLAAKDGMQILSWHPTWMRSNARVS